ncbi:Uncharacterised protein [Mycobacteroides abscessus subsp. abscessus]|uniref:hypothetical protein n=1 Tax=Mycobacteroides abscessus TaxID=36809 RepID=UPI000929D307|nr:hypothetical protein [Mycobacteroides abscessus]SHX89661.1 Uncharacterised protein [Mycobacteroides abscessus subsp. abscessus]SIF60626.1 Uncharacterised protein [Mycobacteroides abscessus subsp. abscessus]
MSNNAIEIQPWNGGWRWCWVDQTGKPHKGMFPHPDKQAAQAAGERFQYAKGMRP